MNIPDEYFTDEVPTERGVYIMEVDHAWSAFITHDGSTQQTWKPGHNRRFCRLVPAAEVPRLKAENEKLRKLGAALRDSAANLGYTSSDDATVIASAELRVEAWDAYIARLEGRAE